MAKEILPPDPIPVGEEHSIDEELYCASFVNYSEKSYTDTCQKLLTYLESEYDNVGFGGTTRSFIARNSTVADVQADILNENINGINNKTVDKYVILSQSDDDVIIFTILY